MQARISNQTKNSLINLIFSSRHKYQVTQHASVDFHEICIWHIPVTQDTKSFQEIQTLKGKCFKTNDTWSDTIGFSVALESRKFQSISTFSDKSLNNKMKASDNLDTLSLSPWNEISEIFLTSIRGIFKLKLYLSLRQPESNIYFRFVKHQTQTPAKTPASPLLPIWMRYINTNEK